MSTKRIYLFTFLASFVLHLAVLPYWGHLACCYPTSQVELFLHLPPIYAKVSNPYKPTTQPKPTNSQMVAQKPKVTTPLPKGTQFFSKPVALPFSKPTPVPGGGGAEVLYRTSPGPGEFVVGGIPTPQGGTGPGLGGSGSAPGIGGPGKEPGMPGEPVPPPPPPPPPTKKEEPPPPPPKKEEPPPPPPPKQEPPPPPPPPVKKEIDPRELAEFKKMVLARIEKAKEYPAQARLSGVEGKVKLSFLVKADGSPSDIKVVESSNSKVLDESAIQTVQKAGPYLPFPKSVDAPAIRISVDIVYKLR